MSEIRDVLKDIVDKLNICMEPLGLSIASHTMPAPVVMPSRGIRSQQRKRFEFLLPNEEDEFASIIEDFLLERFEKVQVQIDELASNNHKSIKRLNIVLPENIKSKLSEEIENWGKIANKIPEDDSNLDLSELITCGELILFVSLTLIELVEAVNEMTKDDGENWEEWTSNDTAKQVFETIYNHHRMKARLGDIKISDEQAINYTMYKSYEPVDAKIK